MSTLIKLRRDSAANWAAADPVLQLGEPGYDTTNNELRIGDGTTAWSGLTPIAGGGGGASLPLANGSSNFNIATSGGNATVTTGGSWTWTLDTAGNLTVPGNIVGTSTIDIDNRATGNSADIRLFSADDILIQARDRDAGSTNEGGDINIYAGDSAENGDTSAGDVQIFAGNGGAANVDYGGTGGFVTIRSGDGGPAIGNSGYSASSGGDLTIRAGDAGANGGNIALGSGGGFVYIYGGTATGNNQAGGAIILTSGTGGPNSAGGNIEVVVPGGDTGPGGTWTFNNAGNLSLPTNGSIVVDGGDGVIGPVSDDFVISWDNEEIRLVSVQGSIEMQADAAFRVQTNYDGANVLYNSRWEFSNNELVNISNNFGIVSEAGNLTLSGGRDGVNSGNTTISAVNVGVAVSNWTFDNTGVLTLPNGGEIDNDSNNIELRAGNNVNFEATGVVNVYTDNGNYQWQFGDDGNLTLPGNTHFETPAGSNGDIIFHPDGTGRVIIEGSTSTLLTLSSDLPDTQNRFEIDTYGANLGNLGGGVFTGTYLRTGGPTQTDDRLASFAGKGTEDGVSIQLPTAAKITLDAAGNWSVGNTPSHISFWTTAVGANASVEHARITPAGNLIVYNGNIIAGNGYSKTTTYTAATLPTGALTQGARAFVSDADTRSFGNLVVGGAGNVMPVWSDGSNWYIG